MQKNQSTPVLRWLSRFGVFRTAAKAEGRLLGWNVPEEYKAHIPSHWLQGYPDTEPMYNYGLGFLYCFFFFFAIAGNGVVMWIFVS